MAWLGVPFVDAVDWEGFVWTNRAFLEQFFEAMNYRHETFAGSGGETTLSMVAGAQVGRITWFNTVRSTNLFDPATNRWVEPAVLANGDAFDVDVAALDAVIGFPDLYTSGQPNQRLIDRINAILTAAGCDTMGATLLSGNLIPWTRKHGANPASLTTSYGAAQAGDVVGPWLFNEWWAWIKAHEAIGIDARNELIDEGDPEVEGDETILLEAESKEVVYTAYPSTESCSDARISADAAFTDEATLTDRITDASAGLIGTDNPPATNWTIRRTRARLADLPPILSAISPDPSHINQFDFFAVAKPGGTFNAFDEAGLALDQVYGLQSVAALPGPWYGSLDPLAVDYGICPLPGGSQDDAHELIICAVVRYAFPDP